MRKTILPLLIVGCLSLAFFPVFKAARHQATASAATSVKEVINSAADHTAEDDNSAAAVSAMLYEKLQLNALGLSLEALQYAYQGYLVLLEKGTIQNSDILTIVDFSQSSRKKRLYIIDVKNLKVLMNTYVAHGKNTGVDMATNFSNTPESLQSSLGFYVTKATYMGKHGLSLRLDGQEKGFNDKAEERAVVVHGADYIGSHRLGSAYMGRSFGCPAVPQHQAQEVIKTIKDGTCMFIYHPSASNYLQKSKLLNS